ncbi:MAG TPA: alpha/beta fold hydrolase, partial [Mucilaginibacter sp.]|nr:alpha/beta fold hydrolase [Mucilaginibacter sp.]
MSSTKIACPINIGRQFFNFIQTNKKGNIMSEQLKYDRRHFLGAAAMTIAAGPLFMIGSADAQPRKIKSANTTDAWQGTNKAFETIKQIDAGVLNIGYAEVGPADRPVVILLHGWPYDIHSFVDVAPLLASKGYRVIIPYLRGFGTTRFLSDDTFRNGQQSAIAQDTIAFMDALKIKKAIIGGFDWGARTTVIMAALWPERVKAL